MTAAGRAAAVPRSAPTPAPAPAPAPALSPAPARHAALDGLRAGTTLLVVFHHAAITYGAQGGWFYVELAPGAAWSSRLLSFFCALNQAWFMGLFFLLAGYFTPAALARKGVAVNDDAHLPDIQPVPIEGPPIPHAPPALGAFHFNDALLAQILVATPPSAAAG